MNAFDARGLRDVSAFQREAGVLNSRIVAVMIGWRWVKDNGKSFSCGEFFCDIG
jgi:hypothetical protein